jgi:hypothetical protein
MPGAHLIRQVRIGQRYLFVFGTTIGGGWGRAGLEFLEDKTRKLRGRFVADPAELLIVQSIGAPVGDLKLPYEHPVADTGLSLQFKGEPYNFDVFDESKPAPNRVLEFYRTAWLAARRQQWDRFIGYHTARGRRFLEKERLENKDRFASEWATLARVRYVKFVVNADPIYLIYYSLQASNDWRPGTLRCEYVVRDTGSQGYRLTSIRFLDDTRLFDQAVFKSALK